MSDKDIKKWWEDNPQSYAAEHGGTTFLEDDQLVTVDFKTRDFFERADRELFAWNSGLHAEGNPFARIFPYDRYRGRSVLEIGCGMGCMASLWAQRGALITAVDLNEVAIEQTRRRFELYGLTGRVQREDARQLSLTNDSFDFAYSWGVLHHSPDLTRSLAEFFRVLKPGGGFGVMLYNRNSLMYWYRIVYLEGLVHAENRVLNSLELASRYTDGWEREGNPHTWPITPAEARTLFAPNASQLEVRVLGTDLEYVLSLMAPGLWRLLPRLARKSLARRWGWSLWISGQKAQNRAVDGR